MGTHDNAPVNPLAGCKYPISGLPSGTMKPLRIHAYVLGALDKAIDNGRLTYAQIAEGSGVPKRTVEKIKRREIEDPGVSHIEKLANFFRGASA